MAILTVCILPLDGLHFVTRQFTSCKRPSYDS